MTTRKELGDRLADMATRFEQRHVYGILSDLRPEDTQVLRASADALREPFEPDPRGSGGLVMSDPASSASLDELVAMNIAGDIEAVADGIREVHNQMSREWVTGSFPLPPMVHSLAAWDSRLRKIAAGIRDRGEGAPHGNGGDGPFMTVPTPSPQPPGGEL